MRILYILPYSPLPPISGGKMRIYHLLKASSVEHDVTVAMYGSSAERDRLKRHPEFNLREVHAVPMDLAPPNRRLAQIASFWSSQSFLRSSIQSQAMQEALDRILSVDRFDIVQIEYTAMSYFGFRTDALRILDAPDIEYDNYRRMSSWVRSPLRKFHYQREYKKLIREETELWQKQDVILVASARDKAILDSHVPSIPKHIIPNGVDSSYFRPSSVTPEPFSLVFTGMMAYLPNYDGMLYFLDEILPLVQKEVPESKIYIVGNRPPKFLQRRATDKVIVTGFVEDVRPYVQRANVYVVPLRMGSGTRLKIVEALAMRKPLVTTSIGYEGIDVKNGETAMIADDPRAFAQSILDLFRNSSLRGKLARNGYDFVKSRYEWLTIGRTVQAVYESLCPQPRSVDRVLI